LFEILERTVESFDEIWSICGKAQVAEPIQFELLDKRLSDLENLMKKHLIYDINEEKDLKGNKKCNLQITFGPLSIIVVKSVSHQRKIQNGNKQ